MRDDSISEEKRRDSYKRYQVSSEIIANNDVNFEVKEN